jgi:ribosome biogenesis protein MAK21
MSRSVQSIKVCLSLFDEILAKTSSRPDSEFVNSILRSGTVTDKVSALSLLIQESPLYSLNLLSSSLISMANKKSRREAILAIDSVKDLLMETILPDRKLKYYLFF